MLIGLLAGCQSKANQLIVQSFRKNGAPETFTEAFPNGAFRINSSRTYEIVMELEPKLIEVPAEAVPTSQTSGPADSTPGASTDPPPPPDLVWTSQLVHIQLLWQAIPGKTYAEQTQTNASIVYCLINGENAISYEGAGFVYFDVSRDGRTLSGRIESASLRPMRFGREPVDLFGACRLTGEFIAKNDSREVATVRQRIRRLLGKPSPGFEGPS